MRHLLLALLLPAVAVAQDKKFVMEPGPKSPEDSLKCIKTRPGFKVELMACEPAVQSPIAFAFGADGKLWVVEMGDYPLGEKGKKGGGCVKWLEKTKPDGLYDKATVFVDNLAFPTGVLPYAKGVLITCAPDILYAMDSKGTGKADKVLELFSGFKEGNQQHRVNGLSWGLDNWIYGANGDSGGKVNSWKEDRAVDINGRDFRIDPERGIIEAVTGQSQFGRCRDDWGNWFGCNNSNPMYHFVLEDRYLKRNPTLLFTDVRVNVSETPGAAEVFPISKPLPRFNSPAALNHFTSACSVMIYRDDLFGPDFEGNSFVCEPVHNLIHREIMRPDGVTFRSKRTDDEKKSEFLASSDNWFRPTTIQTGPDGAIWVTDMYRYVIEHPEWIPKEWQAKLDLRAGHDKGRIYRVYPEDKKPRAIPNLAKLGPKALVAALESPSGWQRDTAQRLLVEKNDGTVIFRLEEMALKGKLAQARVHALMTLHGMRDTSAKILEKTLRDEHPGVRRITLLCSEGRFDGAVEAHGKRLVEDPDPQVQLQLAYALGEGKSTKIALLLAAQAKQARKNRYLSTAILSSINRATYPMFVEALKADADIDLEPAVLDALMRLSVSTGKLPDPTILSRTVGKDVTVANLHSVASFCDALEAQKKDWTSYLSSLDEPDRLATVTALKNFERVFSVARSMVDDPKQLMAERVAAVRLMGRGLPKEKEIEDLHHLEAMLKPETPDELQQAILNRLVKIGDRKTVDKLIAGWKSFTPSLRAQAFDTLMARKEWVYHVLLSIESNKILPGELDAARRRRLLDDLDPGVRESAAKLFGAATSADRAKAVKSYEVTLVMESDAKKGAAVFKRVCAACHRLGEVGKDVGPELASVGDRTPGGLLTAILDPNRAVESRYLNYVATTKAGITLTGILAAETSTSITLLAVDGKKQDILRSDLEDLTCTGKSAMPEGLEKDINLREMADLLSYLTTYLPPKIEKR